MEDNVHIQIEDARIVIDYNPGKMSKESYAELHKILDKLITIKQIDKTDKLYIPIEESEE